MDAPNPSRAASLAIAGLAALWAAALYGMLTLPASIPVRWNDDGSIDAYGSKWTILILPAVGLVAYAITRYVANAPTMRMNLPFDVPEDRIDAVTAVGRRFTRIVGGLLTIGFAAIEAAIVSTSASGHPTWAFGAAIGAFVTALIGTIVLMFVATWRAAH